MQAMAGLPMNMVSTHTPPARCDKNCVYVTENNLVSTHTPPARCDIVFKCFKASSESFYSHTSCEV